MGHDAHHHHHHHHHNDQDERILRNAFILIASFMVVELAVGLSANALVLIADAGHMFLDASALALAWWAARISKRDSDHSLSYGYHRFQVLAAFINGLTLVALVVWIAVEATSRLLAPEPMIPGPTLLVAVAGMVINLIAFKMLHSSSNNANIRGAALHVLGDLLGSVAAILAAGAVYLFGWHYADPLLALLIVVILSRGAYRVIKESAHILLEGVPHGVDLSEIRQVLCQQIPDLVGVHHIHAWALTAEKPLITLHAQVENESQIPNVTTQVKAVLNDKFGINHSTIQVELEQCPDEEGI
ncbi:MAG: cation diffusion facilitator family transporter [Pseudomonadota bacterium]